MFKLFSSLSKIDLWKRILVGMVLGLILGTVVGESIEVIKPIGDMFIRAIKLIVVPLVFTSLIVGITSLDNAKSLGRMTVKAFGIYLTTTAFAIVIGLATALIIQPGKGIEFEQGALGEQVAPPSLIDTFLNIIPTNPFAALVEGNMLQVIVFSCLVGLACLHIGKKATPFLEFNLSFYEIMLRITHIIMEFAPFGVFALMAWVSGTYGLAVILPLMKLALAAVVGCAIHVIFVYGSILKFGLKISPIWFLRQIKEAQMVAFSTSSSSATLPVTMQVAEEELEITPATSSFVLPLGATINMDGSALYQGICTVFVAQIVDIDLTIAQMATVVLTATLASIGTAGVPGASLVMLTMILSSIGLPVDAIAIVLGIDRILDMMRTAVNVTGDLVVTTVVDHTEREHHHAPTTKPTES